MNIIQFFYRSIEKEGSMAGNKIKVLCCFSCAVRASIVGKLIEQEPEQEYPSCQICGVEDLP